MSQNNTELNSKLVEYFNEALAIENVAIDRLTIKNRRIKQYSKENRD